MKYPLIAIACLGILSCQAAPHALAADFQISQAGDLEMNCHEISQEVIAMEAIIAEAKVMENSTNVTETGVTVAKTVGSYLVGSLAGGLGILAAGYIVNEATDDREETAIALQDTAAQRRSFMQGIYNARGCMGPLELASIAPAAGDEDEKTEQKPRVPRYNN